MKPLVDVREPTEADKRFIYNSWLKSYRDGNFVRGVPNTVYFREQHDLIEHLLDRSVALVLTSPEHPNLILGYIVAEAIGPAESQSLVIHYVYMKRDYRKQGFARGLVGLFLEKVQPVSVFYSHKTGGGRFFMEHIGVDSIWAYNPYLAFPNV